MGRVELLPLRHGFLARRGRRVYRVRNPADGLVWRSAWPLYLKPFTRTAPLITAQLFPNPYVGGISVRRALKRPTGCRWLLLREAGLLRSNDELRGHTGQCAVPV